MFRLVWDSMVGPRSILKMFNWWCFQNVWKIRHHNIFWLEYYSNFLRVVPMRGNLYILVLGLRWISVITRSIYLCWPWRLTSIKPYMSQKAGHFLFKVNYRSLPFRINIPKRLEWLKVNIATKKSNSSSFKTSCLNPVLHVQIVYTSL